MLEYLGQRALYQPFYYRGRVYREPRESDPLLNVAVQRELARHGYYRGRIDGVIGADTRRAIWGFQRDRRLPASGWIDGRLLRTLRLI